MKRSALGPGKASLDRRSTFASRGKGLGRGRPRARPSLKGFRAEVTEAGVCALADGRCYGPLDPHHFSPKQRLKDNAKAFLEDYGLVERAA